MAKTNLLLVLCFLLAGCAGSSKEALSTNSEPTERSTASVDDQPLQIRFTSGPIFPRGFSMTLADSVAFTELVNRGNQNNQNLTPEDCDSGDSNGYSMFCGLIKATNSLRLLPNRDPVKRLTPAEYANVAWYAEFGFDAVNEALWSQDTQKLDASEKQIKFVLSAVNRLPQQRRVVVRCDLNDSANNVTESEILRVANRYRQGEVNTIKGFWSTSIGTNQSYINQWVNNCKVLLRINLNGAGALIESISTRPWEQEILVRPLTRFTVNSKKASTKDGKSFFEIELTEGL